MQSRRPKLLPQLDRETKFNYNLKQTKMKTTKLLSIALLAMAVCLGLTSCSKDEEDLIHSTFKSGDLYYEVTSNNTVEVTRPTHYDDSTGVTYFNYEISRAIIPHEVKYKGNIYSVTRIGNYAFLNCKNLTYVSIPNSVTTIGYGAFSKCTSLTSIELPNSVTALTTRAFSECINLESINIPTGVKTIPDAFKFCHKLELPDIPGTVEKILSAAFSGCDYSRLSAINIPDGVKVIEDGAFASAYDTSSSGVTSITIPNSVTEIGSHAFNFHTNLKTIVLGKGLKKLGTYFASGAKNFNVYCLATTPPDQCPSNFKEDGVTVYIPKGSKDSYEAKYYSDWRGCNFVELDEEDFPAN